MKSSTSSCSSEFGYLNAAKQSSIRGELYCEGASQGCEEIKSDKNSIFNQRQFSNLDSEVLRSSRRQSIGSYDSQTSSATADTNKIARTDISSKAHHREEASALIDKTGSRRVSSLSNSAMSIQEDLIAVLQSKAESCSDGEARSHTVTKQLFGIETVLGKTSSVGASASGRHHNRVERSSGGKGQERERPGSNKPEWDGNKKIVYDEDGSWPACASSSSRRDSGAKLWNSSRILTTKPTHAHSMAPKVQVRRDQAVYALPNNPAREHHAHFQDDRGNGTNTRWSSSLDKGRRPGTEDVKASKTDGYFAIAAARGLRSRTFADHGSFIPPPLPLEVQKRRQNGRREMY